MSGALLGLDFGEKRVGAAIAEPLLGIATPLETIEFKSREFLLSGLKRIVQEYGITKIVVGLPKTLKGEMGPAAQRMMANVAWFRDRLSAEWVFWDERLSTREIERILIEADLSRERRKQVRDRLAAQRILQTYMDFHRAGGIE